MAANSLSSCALVAASATSTWLARSPMPCSTSEPITTGARMPAILLQMPISAMRRAALSIGPRIEMYGLTAVCSSARPPPITNSPPSAPPNQRRVANSPNIIAPTAMTARLSARPFFMPVPLRIQDEGSARKKYDR